MGFSLTSLIPLRPTLQPLTIRPRQIHLQIPPLAYVAGELVVVVVVDGVLGVEGGGVGDEGEAAGLFCSPGGREERGEGEGNGWVSGMRRRDRGMRGGLTGLWIYGKGNFDDVAYITQGSH